jgi:hypothetical protein
MFYSSAVTEKHVLIKSSETWTEEQAQICFGASSI